MGRIQAAASIVLLVSSACGTRIADDDSLDGSPVGSDAAADAPSPRPPDAMPPEGEDGGPRPCGRAGDDGPRLVFVTTSKFEGGGGLPSSASGAEFFDGQCTSIAHGAGFAGSFTAYVARPGTPVGTRVGTSPTGWARPDGKIVFSAMSPSDALPLAPIAITEKCATVTDGTGAWTGVALTNNDVALDCSDWGLRQSTGTFGDPGAVDSSWQAKGTSDCAIPRHLYCFQTSN